MVLPFERRSSQASCASTTLRARVSPLLWIPDEGIPMMRSPGDNPFPRYNLPLLLDAKTGPREIKTLDEVFQGGGLPPDNIDICEPGPLV